MYPRSFVVGVIGMVGRDGIAFAIPLLIRSGIRTLTGARSNAHFQTDIVWIGLAIIAVAIPRSGFQTVARLNLIGTARNVEYSMRNDLLRHLFRLDASFWGHTRTGDVMASATNDLTAVRMMLGPGLTSMLESLIALPVAIAVLASVNWRLTVAAMLPSPLAVLLLVRFGEDHPPAFRSHSGALFHHERGGATDDRRSAGGPFFRPREGRAEPVRSDESGLRTLELHPRHLFEHARPLAHLHHRDLRAHRSLVRRSARSCASIERAQLRDVHHIYGDARAAHRVAGPGRESYAARDGVGCAVATALRRNAGNRPWPLA